MAETKSAHTHATNEKKCNVCGSSAHDVLFPEHVAQIHRIVKCRDCGLIYANPQSYDKIDGKVSMDQIDNAEGLEAEEETYDDFIRGLQNYINKQMIQLKDNRKCLNVLKQHNFSGRLLEIGAFTGHFIKEAERYGWQVDGIEPWTDAVKYAKDNLNLQIIPRPFEVVELPAHSYDAICSFHVIEHVYDPESFLLRILKFLNKDGVVVIETPCYDSLMFKILRHRERSMRCNGHLFFFTKASLLALFEKCGFRMIHFERVGRTLSLARLLVNVDIVAGRKKPLFSKLNDRLNLEKFTFTINLRDMLRMYCVPR